MAARLSASGTTREAVYAAVSGAPVKPVRGQMESPGFRTSSSGHPAVPECVSVWLSCRRYRLSGRVQPAGGGAFEQVAAAGVRTRRANLLHLFSASPQRVLLAGEHVRWTVTFNFHHIRPRSPCFVQTGHDGGAQFHSRPHWWENWCVQKGDEVCPQSLQRTYETKTSDVRRSAACERSTNKRQVVLVSVATTTS